MRLWRGTASGNRHPILELNADYQQKTAASDEVPGQDLPGTEMKYAV
jgi:hypothetical protein